MVSSALMFMVMFLHTAFPFKRLPSLLSVVVVVSVVTVAWVVLWPILTNMRRKFAILIHDGQNSD